MSRIEEKQRSLLVEFISDMWAPALIFIGGLGLGFFLGASVAINGAKNDATARGYGQYCAITGKWAWKGECDDEQ